MLRRRLSLPSKREGLLRGWLEEANAGRRNLRIVCGGDGTVLAWSALFLAPAASPALWEAVAEAAGCAGCAAEVTLLLPGFSPGAARAALTALTSGRAGPSSLREAKECGELLLAMGADPQRFVLEAVAGTTPPAAAAPVERAPASAASRSPAPVSKPASAGRPASRSAKRKTISTPASVRSPAAAGAATSSKRRRTRQEAPGSGDLCHNAEDQSEDDDDLSDQSVYEVEGCRAELIEEETRSEREGGSLTSDPVFLPESNGKSCAAAAAATTIPLIRKNMASKVRSCAKRGKELPMKAKEKRGKRNLSCPVCFATRPNLTGLLQHISSHYGDAILSQYTGLFCEKDGWKCPKCDKMFGSRQKLRVHLGVRHKEVFRYLPEDLLELAKRRNNPIQLKAPLKCFECPKAFPTVSMLNQHLASGHYSRRIREDLRKQLGEGKHVSCPLCKITLRTWDHLCVHYASYHNRILGYVSPDARRKLEGLGVKYK